MRSRALSVAGIGVTALALATSFAGMANAASGPSAAHASTGAAAVHVSKGKTCYSNLDGDSGVGIVSQNFEAAYDQYDNQGAADFSVKKKCTIKKVMAPGVYFNGTGPATSETVTIYMAKKGLPGKAVSTQTVNGADAGGSFTMKLKKTKLKKGDYFVSVQANLDFGVGGEWGWETTTNQAGKGDVWQNPGDGFATGCTKYADMVTCLGAQGQGPDFMVSVGK